MNEIDENDIAIVGMALRVAGANTPEEYWQNLVNGVEGVVQHSDEELLARGVSKRDLANPGYVKAGIPLQNVDKFDPEFFGFSPKEGAILDPQHRHFYEVSWEALERAGHPPRSFDGSIGVFAGCGMGAYFSLNLLTNPDLVENVGLFLLRHTGNDKDFLSTRVSYAFDLKGPSVNVQTACSTSLVATHLAAQSLLSLECDMALAGGVTIDIPHNVGYHYKEGEVLSPDGHCRAFDQNSKGTVFGSGAGVVVLRRLADALEDGDHIHGVIKGSAINNDGASKVGYLAPSVDGQTAAIAEALAVADVDAESIQYIECHGTGTPVGDPIEVAALTKAFRESTDASGFCKIGSVKTNIGHLDTAAGVASLIKATLAVEHGEIPPSLNFESPNPQIDFDNSPFKVNAERSEWHCASGRRRAAINSLGVGGTNAFVIIEQPPEPDNRDQETDNPQFITLSGRSKKALDDNVIRLAEWLEDNPEASLQDVSYSLAVGREPFEYRRVLAAQSAKEAIEVLRGQHPRRLFNHSVTASESSITFLFPGGGVQYFQMGQGLYDSNSIFKKHMDHGFELLQSTWDVDLASVFHARESDQVEIERLLENAAVQLPLTFLVEYALAQVWLQLGIEPTALIGHSMGENTAACIAGVMSFDEALGLVLLRGQLVDTTPAGGVLSVPMPAEELMGYLGDSLDLASANGPSLSVASGSPELLDDLASRLAQDGVESQRVRVNVAAHSRLLDGILDKFKNRLSAMQLNPPKIPIVSNVSGDWLTSEQAQSPEYWVGHLRNTVQFAKGVETLVNDDSRVFLEIGPGNSLSSLVRQQPKADASRVVSSMRHPDDETSDAVYLKAAQGRIWTLGTKLPLEALWQQPKRIPLPTYAFQHARYWIDPGVGHSVNDDAVELPERLEELSDWFFEPRWIPNGITESNRDSKTWLIFENDEPIATNIIRRLKSEGHRVISVRPGDVYRELGEDQFTLAPEAGGEGYDELVKCLRDSDRFPDHIVHSWLVTWDTSYRPGSTFFHRLQNQGFYSLFYLAKALSRGDLETGTSITVLTNNAQSINGELVEHPDKATILGPTLVIPREMPDVICKAVDLNTVTLKSGSIPNAEDLDRNVVENVLEELYAPSDSSIVAWRNGVRYTRNVLNRRNQPNTSGLPLLKNNATYLITGGFGGIATVLADWLVKTFSANLVLIGRTPIPNRDQWADWLANHSSEDEISQVIARIQDLESLGVDVLAMSADVTVADQMTDVLTEARQRFGSLQGIFHTAGTIRDSLIAIKSQREIEEVFAAKVYGSIVLDEVFSQEPLDFMVLFGSSSAFVAPQGQVDYVAANSFLNTFAQSKSVQRSYPTIALNWGIWRDVGMVAVTDQTANNLIEEAAPYYPAFANHLSGHEGLKEIHRFEGQFSAADWVIDEHRLKNGDALLPGTGYLELIRAAIAESHHGIGWSVENLTFERPMFVPENLVVRFYVEIRGIGQNWRVEIGTQIDESSWLRCIKASIRFNANGERQLNVAEIEARLKGSFDSAAGSGYIQTRQEDHLKFGPRWNVLRNYKMGDGEALGKLRLDDQFSSDLDHFHLHPGLLDIATGFAMDLIPGYAEQEIAENLWVPMAYARFEYKAPLSTNIVSWVRLNTSSRPDLGMVAFDITLSDSSGQVLAEISKLTLQKSQGQFELSMVEQPGNTEHQTPGELLLAHNASQGIDATSAMNALNLVLTNPVPHQVMVSSLNFKDLVAQAEHITQQASADSEMTRFERPELDTEFEEARDDIEKALSEMWGKLLGVEGVGIHDSFFDLGGHSLIAVRLFNEIRDRFETDLPMSVLMQAPSIEELANIIRGRPLGKDDPSNDEVSPNTERLEPAFRYVVPMHSGTVGGDTPLFMVAGMFGNVLNLSHLAHLLGEERPFFALQAKGLYGDADPHESFEEMATDYITEIRQVQPTGPYLLGGYSGGGLIAYEIARQLIASGDEVSSIIMLDTPVRTIPNFSLADKISMVWQGVKTNGWGYILEKFKARARWAQEERDRAMHDDDPLSFQSKRIGEAFMRALGKYQLQALDIPVTVFRPKLNVKFVLSGNRLVDSERNYVSADNGWSKFVRQLEVIEVPGNHDSMVLEPNVRILVSLIRRVLAPSADEGATGSVTSLAHPKHNVA